MADLCLRDHAIHIRICDERFSFSLGCVFTGFGCVLPLGMNGGLAPLNLPLLLRVQYFGVHRWIGSCDDAWSCQVSPFP